MRWLAWVAVGIVVVVGLLWLFQRRLIYLPTHDVPPAAAVVAGAEEASLLTADGLTLDAWFVPGRHGDGAAVAVFTGNAGNRSHRAPLALALAEHGLSLLLVDYRGYGGNPGRPTEDGLAADARAARAYLEQRPEVDGERLVYFGESLGAAVALGLALEEPPAALVLRSPFTSLADVASIHYPILPVGLLLRDRYPSLERIADLATPVLVIAGEADRIVPFEQSRRLYEAAPGPSRLLALPGADHNDPALAWGPEVVAAVVEFLRDHGVLVAEE